MSGAVSHTPGQVVGVIGNMLTGLFGWFFAIVGWGLAATLLLWIACKLRLFSRIRIEWRRWKHAGRTPFGTPAH